MGVASGLGDCERPYAMTPILCQIFENMPTEEPAAPVEYVATQWIPTPDDPFCGRGCMPPNPVPEPQEIALFVGIALAGFAVARKRMRK